MSFFVVLATKCKICRMLWPKVGFWAKEEEEEEEQCLGLQGRESSEGTPPPPSCSDIKGEMSVGGRGGEGERGVKVGEEGCPDLD